MWKAIFIGGGPSAMWGAYELVKKSPELASKIVIVEQGRKAGERICPKDNTGTCVNCKLCNEQFGVGGAGANCDGKTVVYPSTLKTILIGGRIQSVISGGVEATINYSHYMYDVLKTFGAPSELKGLEFQTEIEDLKQKSEQVGLELTNYPICHLGTDGSRQLYKALQNYLISAGVSFMVDTEVKDIVVEDGVAKGVIYSKKDGKEGYLLGEKVISAVGRGGSVWFLEMCKKYGVQFKPGKADIGVRYELPNTVMANVNKWMYEGKFYGHPQPYCDQVRTFCVNPGGIVAKERYKDGTALVNGHAFSDPKKKTNNTNLALMVTLDLREVEDPMAYCLAIAQNVNRLSKGEPCVQRYGDLKAGKRTWENQLVSNSVVPTLKDAVPGDLSLSMPHRVMEDLKGFIEMMDKVLPGFADPDNLLYGVETKLKSNEVCLSGNFETSLKNLYAIGDGCGLTGGLMQASISGIHVARHLFD